MYRKRSFGEKASDKITNVVGSWTFVLLFIVFVVAWSLINLYGWLVGVWDPYPFILLNLALSCLAAIQAPLILMSQNRATQRDRATAQRDHLVNVKAEREVADMQKDLEVIKQMIRDLPQKKGNRRKRYRRKK